MPSSEVGACGRSFRITLYIDGRDGWPIRTGEATGICGPDGMCDDCARADCADLVLEDRWLLADLAD